jgi:hypothetical protein
MSFWVKRAKLSGGTEQVIFGCRQGASFPATFSFGATDNILFTSGPTVTAISTTALFRDVSAWYHIVVAVTPSATSYLYVNGVQIGSWTASSNPYLFNSSYTNAIGRYGDANQNYFDGYLTEINFIDGQALTPSFFGETDPYTGRWKAKAYTGTFGNNGFYLKFADNSGTTATTLGKDSAGTNNWTPNNFSVTAGAGNDSLVDSPTNYGADTGLGGEVRGNYATLNPSDNGGLTLGNGNLDLSASAAYQHARSGFGLSSGKWYFEAVFGSTTSASIAASIGVATSSAILPSGFSGSTGIYFLNAIGTLWFNNQTSQTNISGTISAGTVLQCAIDVDVGKVWIGQNNTWYNSSGGTTGAPSTGSNPTFSPSGTLLPFAGGVSNTASLNFGQRPFAYTAPTGFKALCTQNLPQPTIQKPSKYMDALTYTGTGASNAISSLGFSPDLVWIKNRGTTTSHAIYDTTRGAQSQLSSDTTGDQVTSSSGLTTFGSNGFTLGTSTLVNTSGTQYVAWAWDQSTQDGFTISTYTGNGANRTIAHTLGVAPKMVIVKARTTAGADQGWPVWHTSIANTTYLQLNSTSSTSAGADYWNSTSPTSSVFSVGTNVAVNASADTYIAYLFAEVDGFSKFGTYTGNGAADGPFVHCGFRPRFVMIKTTQSSLAWIIYDTARSTENLVTLKLAPNNSQEENGSSIGGVTFNTMDILSNGFKLRSTNLDSNQSGVTFIFAAFAESPFKYARAR